MTETARNIYVSEFRLTPPCPSCGAHMVWGDAIREYPNDEGQPIRGMREIDVSRHEPFCPESDKPDFERAAAIRAGARR